MLPLNTFQHVSIDRYSIIILITIIFGSTISFRFSTEIRKQPKLDKIKEQFRYKHKLINTKLHIIKQNQNFDIFLVDDQLKVSAIFVQYAGQ